MLPVPNIPQNESSPFDNRLWHSGVGLKDTFTGLKKRWYKYLFCGGINTYIKIGIKAY